MVKCEACGEEFVPKSKRSSTCSDRCRMRLSRARSSGPSSASAVDADVVVVAGAGVLVATLRELERAKRADSPLGQIALALAGRLQFGTTDTGSAVASVAKELRATLDAALAGAEREVDAVDELKLRREQRRRGA